MTNENTVTPKRVDETWKSQVEHEKSRDHQPPTTDQRPTASTTSPTEAAPQPVGDQRFEALISSLAMEAFVHLGDVPHPSTQRAEVNLQQAKYVIDLLGALEKKTQGNLTPTESQQLSEFLYQLRMRYVEKTQPPIPPPPGSKESAR